MSELLTVKDLAIILSYSEQHVRRLLVKGELPGVKIGETWRTSKAELIAFWTARGGKQLFDE